MLPAVEVVDFPGVASDFAAFVAMSTSVIDYFAVLGRGDGHLQCDPFTNLLSDEKNVITASEVLDEAITDIAVLTAGRNTTMI